MSGDDAIAVFKQLGFVESGQSGSHAKLVRVTQDGERQVLTVPKHRELDAGTLRAIVRQASRFVEKDALRRGFYAS